ncbi:MAG: Integrase core domain protein [Candidatus Woesebacteria bacterium GW2011_GWA2_40_7b]|uniref:Integrase core domain protein n=1 Tax=Candidatus Woesebacteria bacterium GW2011_GWA2_40_7b TaxID=1618563 RepID=A0A0G0VDE1_9BACT|nr:MAG: Integrase core domain protein [Candidatus Woesebacteria bacterium GW2011_GWA2_40_7b]
MIESIRRFSGSEIAIQKLKIINFYASHGEISTKEAFGVDRKVISRWKTRLNNSDGKLASLVPFSTKPVSVRIPTTRPEIVDFIKGQREAHFRIGKEKLKVFLDRYCEENYIPKISISTIGNIIKRHNFFYQDQRKVYHDPSSGWAQRGRKKTKRLRIKHSFHPNYFGYILSDSVERITDGIKDYFISAIDAKMKFSLTLNYKRLTSENMTDFYLRFKDIYPGKIKMWQSDNGGENLGLFDAQLKKDNIPHYFIYPRCPKIDTFIERYNRTLQDDNSQRPHHSLNLKSPLQYFMDEGGMSQMSLTYTKT